MMEFLEGTVLDLSTEEALEKAVAEFLQLQELQADPDGGTPFRHPMIFTYRYLEDFDLSRDDKEKLEAEGFPEEVDADFNFDLLAYTESELQAQGLCELDAQGLTDEYHDYCLEEEFVNFPEFIRYEKGGACLGLNLDVWEDWDLNPENPYLKETIKRVLKDLDESYPGVLDHLLN